MSEIRANSITDAAGTGAPNFPNGMTGLNVASAGDISQILLNRPSESNFSLDNGVYNANFDGGSVTGFFTKSITSITLAANLIPVMSGGTTSACSSGSVSCSVTPAGYGNLSTLFDNGSTYFEQYTSSTMTVTVDLGATAVTAGYFIDRFINSTYQPRTWTFQGSANNSTWVTLDSYNSNADWGAQVLTRYAVGSYRYYRWAFTANNGAPGTPGGYVIDEMNIVSNAITGSFTSETYTAATAPTSATVKARIVTGTAPVSGSTYTLSASRDNGTTWTALPFTVSSSNSVADSAFYISGTASIASQPSGTQMKYKIEASSAPTASITAVTFEWS
jgi:hypothetical protein